MLRFSFFFHKYCLGVFRSNTNLIAAVVILFICFYFYFLAFIVGRIEATHSEPMIVWRYLVCRHCLTALLRFACLNSESLWQHLHISTVLYTLMYDCDVIYVVFYSMQFIQKRTIFAKHLQKRSFFFAIFSFSWCYWNAFNSSFSNNVLWIGL